MVFPVSARLRYCAVFPGLSVIDINGDNKRMSIFPRRSARNGVHYHSPAPFECRYRRDRARRAHRAGLFTGQLFFRAAAIAGDTVACGDATSAASETHHTDNNAAATGARCLAGDRFPARLAAGEFRHRQQRSAAHRATAAGADRQTG